MGNMRCFTFHVYSVETLVPCFPEGTCRQFPKIQRNPQNPQAAKVKLQRNTSFICLKKTQPSACNHQGRRPRKQYMLFLFSILKQQE